MATSKEKLDQEELMLRCPFLKRRRRISFVHHRLGLGQLGRLERLAAQQGLHVGAWHRWSGNVSSYGKWPVGKSVGLNVGWIWRSFVLLVHSCSQPVQLKEDINRLTMWLGVVQTWSSLSSAKIYHTVLVYFEFYFFPFVKLLTTGQVDIWNRVLYELTNSIIIKTKRKAVLW